jgi:leucyl aminopeptidase (aminopeptidase T)
LPPEDYDPYEIIDIRKLDGREGKLPLLFCLLPSGELNIAPVEGTGNGKLVIDLCIHHIGRVFNPIELHVAEARMLRDYLHAYGDENATRCPAEASVGVNKKALVRGVQREDKNIHGAMHFGIGTNVDVGGNVLSNIHMDGVILEPSLYVDGALRIEHGRFLVPIEGEQ